MPDLGLNFGAVVFRHFRATYDIAKQGFVADHITE